MDKVQSDLRRRFCRFIGLHPQLDREWLWLVNQAISTPIPTDWKEEVDTKGRIFYQQQEHCSWMHPLVPSHRDTFARLIEQGNQDTLYPRQGKEEDNGQMSKDEDDSMLFYKDMFGIPEVSNHPERELFFMNSFAYLHAGIDEMIEVAELLEIDVEKEVHLLWIARLVEYLLLKCENISLFFLSLFF